MWKAVQCGKKTGSGPRDPRNRCWAPGVPLGCDLRLGTESATDAGANEAQLQLPLSSWRARGEVTQHVADSTAPLPPNTAKAERDWASSLVRPE